MEFGWQSDVVFSKLAGLRRWEGGLGRGRDFPRKRTTVCKDLNMRLLMKMDRWEGTSHALGKWNHGRVLT